MLNTLKNVPYEEPEYHYFSPQDLATMRHAYCTASLQRPEEVQTPAERQTLAKAIISVFDSTLSEASMVAAAWLLLRQTHA
jgi:hypothetical protein